MRVIKILITVLIFSAVLGNANLVLAENECNWFAGSGGSTCQDVGYPIISTKNTCLNQVGDSPGLQYVCCCRVIEDDAQVGANVDDTQAGSNVRDIAGWDVSGLTNPVQTVEPAVVIGRVVRALLLVIGSLALLIFIYAGFTWMTASGNEAKIAKARNTLVWATLGMVVIFSAYLLVQYVLETVGAI